ncbi:HalOD1 output domain-containing protein [Salinigranum halophilum]|jgi:hypothetical protein|uniref:HalOD1 output domain-containing protein n=1 Tax=Salinigranum halophilum TaxID=2565931 RepID=UPI0010A80DBB|nr:HalOD1 output domain-containing protein [Salinigranum halophilum]
MNTSDSADARPDESVIAREPLTHVPPSKAILHAFERLDVDLVGNDERLADLVDPDALDELIETADQSVRFSATLWGHPVVVTTDAVHVFDADFR